MSLQALMALLGHVTAEMTLRYATLASPTLRAAYDEAIGKVRQRRLPIILDGRPALPAKVDWLRGELLKTRVAHGYCCTPPRRRSLPLRQHLRDTATTTSPRPSSPPPFKINSPTSKHLHDDAERRGWTSEASPPPTASSNTSDPPRPPQTATRHADSSS